ncbi:MAG: ABC transporter substrate-binding protein [Armatimonadetes bacterium]|nr:ABC transporter substrate-binding protein [Armatimonadota bacterium]
MRGQRWRGLVALLAGLLIIGMGSAVQSAPASDTVVVAFGAELTTMDPPFFTSSNEQTVYYHLFDTLVTRDANDRIIPWLATSWSNPNSLTWEFKLRSDVRWHNGDPFTAEDVKFTFDRIIDPAKNNPSRSKFPTLTEVRVVEPHTVRLITKGPDPLMLARLAGISAWIVPAKYIREKGDQYFARNPIGTGSYKFVEWVRDDHLTLEAMPRSWAGRARVRRIITRPVREASTRLALLRTGEVGIVQNVPPDQVDALKTSPDVEVVTQPSLRSMYIILRSDMEPTNNKKLRQAMNHAVNKEAIIKGILRGFGIVSRGQPMGKEYFGFNAKLQPYPYDVEKAKQLMAEAGHARGLSDKRLSPSGRYQQDKEIAQAVAGQLGAIGVRVDLDLVEFASYVRLKLERRIHPLTLGAWSQPIYDADGVFRLLYGTNEPWGVHYSNAHVDKLLLEAALTLNPQRRQKLYEEVSEIGRDDAPVIFLHQLVDLYARRRGAPVRPLADETIVVLPKWELIR